MKNYNFTKAIFAVLLGIIFMPTVTNAQATDWTETDSLPSASGEYKLKNDVTVNTTWDLVGKDITLDLNGKQINTTGTFNVTGESKLTINDSSSTHAGVIRSTSVNCIIIDGATLTMNAGTIKAAGEGLTQIFKTYGTTATDKTNYTVVNFNKDAKVINDGDATGIYAFTVQKSRMTGATNQSNGVVINARGTLDLRLKSTVPVSEATSNCFFYINGTVNNTEGNVPIINMYDTVNAQSTVTHDHDTLIIYAAGYGKWNIYGGNYVGHEGLSIKSGDFTITDGKFESYGEYIAIPIQDNNGEEETGAAISITSNAGYANKTKIRISGGEFISKNNSALFEGIATSSTGTPAATTTHLKELTITGGYFKGGEDRPALKISNIDDVENLSITGGTYSTNPKDFKKAGYVIVDNPNEDYKYEIAQSYNRVVSHENKNITTEKKEYVQSKSEDLVLVFNGLMEDFKELKINGKVVPTDMYTVTKGSTIITLKAAYLKTLEPADYTVKAVYTDGEVETTIKVYANNPNTLDNTSNYIFLGLFSVLGLTSALYFKKKRFN